MKPMPLRLEHSASSLCTFRTVALGYLAVFGLHAVAAADDQPLPSVPLLKCPVYVMEYHVWYRSPFGHGPLPGYVHWGDAEHIDSALPEDQNIRDIGAVGYPLLGLYDSQNTDLIRWQLRCAHNAGIDGLFVQLYPDRVTGTYLGGSKIFATMLKIAGEEHIKIAAHDEVMFRPGWKAQQPGVMATRIANFIDHYGSDPAYLKIDGHPAYSFQYWNRFIPPGEMAQCLDHAEELAGTPIHFLILGGTDELYRRSSAASFVMTGNSIFIKSDAPTAAPGTADWLKLSAYIMGLPFLQSSHPADKFGLWAYPGFNNQPQGRMLGHPETRGFARDQGGVLAQTLTIYSRVHPDFILLSSWNDWLENTAFEPGYRFDDGNQPAADPYRYCRILAAAKGATFEPPPLPPKEAVDPLRWQSLYGIDATPPRLKSFRAESGRLLATWTDSGSAVTHSILAESGDAWVDFISHTAQGISYKMNAGLAGESGLPLTPRGPLKLPVDALSGDTALSEWYVAIQFEDDAPETIHIRYPAVPPNMDYREFDGVTFPAEAVMRTHSTGAIRTEVSLLRGADFSSTPHPSLAISATPAPGGKSPSGAVRLLRLDLFHSLRDGIAGVSLDPAPQAGHETPFQYSPANPSGTVFLFAGDAKNNWSAPQAVVLGH